MTNNMYIDIDEAFGLLQDLSELPEGNRFKYFNSKNIELLKLLWADICEDELLPEIKHISDFINIAKHLMQKEANWSKKIGMALIEASKYKEVGDIDRAVFILDSFISNCSSPSFKEIARVQRENYLA